MISYNERLNLITYLSFSLFSTSILFAQDSLKTTYLQKKYFSDNDYKTWYHKDLKQDTIPGISLDRAYRELLLNKKGKEVIVAVIDTKLDIHHEDLKDQIWINKGEIPNNNIDDDKNGYIDDVNGWDFLSNSKGEFLKYANLECMRIIRKYKLDFDGREEKDLAPGKKEIFKIYQKAKKEYDHNIKESEDFIKSANLWLGEYPKAKKTLKTLFPNENYKVPQLDSLIKLREKDSLTIHHVKFIRTAINNDITPKLYTKWRDDTEGDLKFMLNMDLKERKIIGDDAEDISDVHYGSNIVYGDVPFQHSTSVTGVLGAIRDNDLGINGISNNIKIMPVVMVASGDEHDKDVALAIRYAVDNGADVINMSWGKTFSLHKEWVYDAIKYAAKNDVLLVTASGNENKNADNEISFPNDNVDDKEIVNNFIVVGASSYFLNKKLTASFSDYGKNNVDVFAPGNKIYTTGINNTYEYSRGTSIASPLVAGIAALIKSYYPNLSAKQIKEIILESGVAYNIDVRVYQEDNSQKLMPFSKLSKSGKIVNAYNALVLADKILNTKE